MRGSPPCRLPELSCRNVSRGGDGRPLIDPGKASISRGRIPVFCLPPCPRNFCSRGREVDSGDTDSDERRRGAGRGGGGDDGEVSPTPPHACFPLLSSG